MVSRFAAEATGLGGHDPTNRIGAMAKFSERLGITTTSRNLQVESMDAELRSSLWNVLSEHLDHARYRHWREVLAYAARDHFKVAVDSVPAGDNARARNWLRNHFFEASWHEVYDLIEFIVDRADDIAFGIKRDLVTALNDILVREVAGYRFIAGVLAPVTNASEALAISEAMEHAQRFGFGGIFEHLQTALVLLSKKPDPDYRNSIKESISAVEAAAKLISGTSSGGLDPAIEAVASRVPIHGAMKAGFKSLYGYSSNEDGIRHAILEESHVGFDEAKYMLVACSAFVNFLIAKAEQAGLIGGS